ncbi:hypothetical protein [Paraburkholderia caballeronis]|uniref:hypothetical protein n=1 Tax=Paraburkholderia caballeronis TaxID=416943 RepID=UPI00106647C1|nr:hypothetical protein [Paraburkholderia caballeronis]TDV06033.1 hypothetical protein C7408_12414 [Paraburkholderia caballeronis]TDV09573.1 hypothetical protein C7406_12614 [Paraburkholderia caballeronis]TDV21638.1 hypothetical protein C7404_12114 [Paraburkholderia caballeronis]
MVTLPVARCEGLAKDIEDAVAELRSPTSSLRRQALAAFLDVHAALLRKSIAEQAPRGVHFTGEQS